MQLPGKHAVGPSGWFVQAKLSIYLWLGVIKHKEHFYEGLPKGYEMSQELRNADRERALAPNNIHYMEKFVSFLNHKICSNKLLILLIFRHFNYVLIFIKLDH